MRGSCLACLQRLVLLVLVPVCAELASAAQDGAEPARSIPARRFLARDFGAVPDGKTDAGPGIRAAIQAAIREKARSEVVLDAGDYRVMPDGSAGASLPIAGARGLTLRGAGRATRLILGDPASGGILLQQGEEVSVCDLSIDYDPLPFCQGTVRDIDLDSGSFELEVDRGYPSPDEPNFRNAPEPYGKWGMIIDRKTRRIRAGTPDHYMTPRWSHVGDRTWRLFTANEHHRQMLAHMRIGDAYVHLARGHGNAFLAQACDGIRIENVTIHAAPALAVGLVGNRGELIVRGLEVAFAPGSDRLITTNADGVHCQQNRSGPIIEDCYFEGMADDAINIYAPPNVLREVRSPTQWLVSPGCLVLPGDRLQVVEPRTGFIRGIVVARSVEVDRAKGAFLLTLSAPLEAAMPGADHQSADTLYNLNACGAGFQIRRNQMKGNRRYGCLLRAGDGVVEDNLFEDTTGAGVVLTNEPDWPEGPVPWGITVRKNRFVRGGTCLGYADTPQGGALSVRGVRLGHSLANRPSLHLIELQGNTVVDRAGTAIYVGGARDVTISDTTIQVGDEVPPRPEGGSIVLERSEGIRLRNTSIQDHRSTTSSGIHIGKDMAPGTKGVSIELLTVELAPGSSPVRDLREAEESLDEVP